MAAVQAVTPRDNVDKKEVSDERNALEPLAYGTLVAKLRQRVEISFQVRAILSELQGLARGAKGQSVALPNVPGANDMPAYGAVVTGWVDVTKEVLAAQAAAEGTEVGNNMFCECFHGLARAPRTCTHARAVTQTCTRPITRMRPRASHTFALSCCARVVVGRMTWMWRGNGVRANASSVQQTAGTRRARC